MSVQEIVAPVWKVLCDHDGCERFFVGHDYQRHSDRAARRGAELAGWKIRPWAGAGSRSAPDLCPTHGGAS